MATEGTGLIRGRRKKSHAEWLKDQLAPLVEIGERVATVHTDVAHTYGWHTGLKLAAIRHATDVFSTVGRSVVHDDHTYRKSVYLDLFAGCGLNRMANGDVVAGSPFVGLSAPRAFDQIILVEARADYCEALRARVALSPDVRVTIVDGDCNNSVPRILEKVGEKNSMVFTVLDQETLQAKWETIRQLSDAFRALDIFLTLPTGIERVLAAAEGQARASPTMEATTGLTVAEILRMGEGSASDAIAGQIREVLGRELGQTCLIRDTENRPLYEVQIYTRSTRGKSPYWKGYEAIAGRLEHLSAREVEGALNDIKGRSLGSRN